MQTLLTNLSGKSGSRRRRLIPELNKFTRNMTDFKNKTHNALKGDALLDLKFQAEQKDKLEQLRRQNMQFSNYLHEVCCMPEKLTSAEVHLPETPNLVNVNQSARDTVVDTVVTKSM